MAPRLRSWPWPFWIISMQASGWVAGVAKSKNLSYHPHKPAIGTDFSS